MRAYRVKNLRNGIALLQRRRFLIFWETVDYGAEFSITAKAIHLSK